jgi:hypothetical protein
MNIKINVGGVVCKIDSDNEVINLIKEKCIDFLTNEGEDFFLKIEFGEEIEIKEVVNKNGQVVELSEEREKIYDKKDYYFINCNLFYGNLYFNGGNFIIRYNKSYLWLIVRNLLRACYSLIIFNKNGFLMHGSCVICENKAYLFCGKPGAGKSTVAKLSNRKVLSDETLIIKELNDHILVYGTPFGGELKPLNEKETLNKIFFLIQDKKTYFEKLGLAEKISEFMQHEFLSYTIFFNENKELSKSIFRKVYNLLKKVECYNMYFAKENNLIERVEEIDNKNKQ